MEFEHSEKVGKLQERVEAFMVEHIYPNEEELFAQVNEGDRWQPVPLLEELKAKARAAELWNLFLPEKRLRCRADEPRICTAMRDHGPLALGARGVQLFGTRYWQHGSPGALRHTGAAQALA
jgi:alkylation response protein AidB-like acyl-CoA dehydrogenase